MGLLRARPQLAVRKGQHGSERYQGQPTLSPVTAGYYFHNWASGESAGNSQNDRVGRSYLLFLSPEVEAAVGVFKAGGEQWCDTTSLSGAS